MTGSNGKRTPGPWRAAIGQDWRPRANESELEIACLPHNTCDAIDVFGPDLDRELTADELRENARLIAAAPDLLDALKSLRIQALQSSINNPANEWGMEALGLADAAIRKAEGRT